MAGKPIKEEDAEKSSSSDSTQLSQQQELEQEQLESQEFYNAIQWTVGWVSAAIMFGAGLHVYQSPQESQDFLTTYFLELTLSLENLLAFAYLLHKFQIPEQYQGNILNWSLGGALILRGIIVGLGTMVLNAVPILRMFLAGIFFYTAQELAIRQYSSFYFDTITTLSDGSVTTLTGKVKFAADWFLHAKRFHEQFEFSPTLDGGHFWTRTESGRMVPTPLFQCLLALVGTNAAFAIESIPVGLGVTTKPLVLLFSNLWATIGLRSLFTILPDTIMEFKYMDATLSILFGFVGAKTIFHDCGVDIPTIVSLGCVLTICLGGIGYTWLQNQIEADSEDEGDDDDDEDDDDDDDNEDDEDDD